MNLAWDKARLQPYGQHKRRKPGVAYRQDSHKIIIFNFIF